ncbi:MAG TPA: hypothetical protein VFM23_00825 [Gemmatimonadales bacterium]|nr:hypothetical protein [Gemmatimonadales bacterium]
MRFLPCLLLVPFSTLAMAANFRAVEQAARDDQMLIMAGVEPEHAELRAPCAATIIESGERPNFFNCVYVQTPHDLNLFSLEDGYLMSELQLALSNMDGVALQHMGRYSQVQIFSGHRVAVLYIQKDSWIDKQQTEAIYQWLIDHGVEARQPRKWVGP